MHSSSAFLLKVVIEQRRSCRERLLIAALVLLALAGLGMSGLLSPGWPRAFPPAEGAGWLAVFLVVAAGCREMRRTSPANPGYVAFLAMLPGGKLSIGPAVTQLRPARVTKRWLLPRHAIGLAYVGEDGVRGRLLLFRADIRPELWRRLVVHLRFT